ncbi:hypothetical protein, partial [Streptomyces ossamyceticus]|uniref:hypothetical protein n=1 Tax=Streptomyces ossamyceticus TaxID=249581 RepID=UPI001969AB2A
IAAAMGGVYALTAQAAVTCASTTSTGAAPSRSRSQRFRCPVREPSPHRRRDDLLHVVHRHEHLANQRLTRIP